MNLAENISHEVPEGFVQYTYGFGFIETIAPIYVRKNDGPPAMAFRVLQKHINPIGTCHGGMMMTLMDMAAGQAVIHHSGRNVFPPTMQLNADFLQTAQLGEWLESSFDFVKTTPRTGFVNGYLNGPNGPVLRVNGICKLPKDSDARFARQGDPVMP
jgi:uncharacterized protein (TIGR00369 family)